MIDAVILYGSSAKGTIYSKISNSDVVAHIQRVGILLYTRKDDITEV